VFQLFRKLHKNDGKGIGLALCKKIAENHQGSITITSGENEGTTIGLFLPVDIGGVWV
jgi:signal transduction histidine kinase